MYSGISPCIPLQEALLVLVEEFLAIESSGQRRETAA
jgi:hypothetical protein